ncbi:glutathione S-transferase C-terminal domain-containing protein [bacterium AH-315-P15]|nr:glutathione S-transferase C-terminal domain-containing protein [bacterium AH-315-P15]
MGRLIEGRWCETDDVIEDGAFVRSASPLQGAHRPNVLRALSDCPGRFWLIASWSCPWSHRTTIVRKLKGLETLVPVYFGHGPRVQGYALAGGAPWAVPGTREKIQHLHELYRIHDRTYTGRSTVPVLWDSETQTIVSNESADIIQALDAVESSIALDFTLRPSALIDDIDTANDWIYGALNNAVYCAGFAQSQDAYDEAVALVFETLDRLEARLSSLRYFFGSTLTETDVRLLPTLLRFDAIYYILFKCSRRRLVDYPNLWAYARDVYSWRGVADTVDFGLMRAASYLADADVAHPLIAVAPDADWTADHGRAAISPACITFRNGVRQAVDPRTLAPLVNAKP